MFLEILLENTDLIFALLAVVFAFLNLFLWLTAWRSMSRDRSSGRVPDELSDTLQSLRKLAEKEREENLKIEDQLWSVLDKLREIKERDERIDRTETVMGGMQKDPEEGRE